MILNERRWHRQASVFRSSGEIVQLGFETSLKVLKRTRAGKEFRQSFRESVLAFASRVGSVVGVWRWVFRGWVESDVREHLEGGERLVESSKL